MFRRLSAILYPSFWACQGEKCLLAIVNSYRDYNFVSPIVAPKSHQHIRSRFKTSYSHLKTGPLTQPFAFWDTRKAILMKMQNLAI